MNAGNFCSIFPLIFYLELGETSKKSILGEILETYRSGRYRYDEYISLFKYKKVVSSVVKVYTGR